MAFSVKSAGFMFISQQLWFSPNCKVTSPEIAVSRADETGVDQSSNRDHIETWQGVATILILTLYSRMLWGISCPMTQRSTVNLKPKVSTQSSLECPVSQGLCVHRHRRVKSPENNCRATNVNESSEFLGKTTGQRRCDVLFDNSKLYHARPATKTNRNEKSPCHDY